VTVSGKGSGRISIAGLLCLKEGHRGRLIYRTITHRGRKGERRSFAETDYIALLDAAHHQLDAPIIVVWDNLNVHVSAAMRALIAARDWLIVIRLPAYAPDLNPTEGVWAHMKRGLGNAALHGIDDLAATIRRRLRHIQRTPDLIAGFLAQTGMTLEPEMVRP
jgi:putative transposase